MQISDNLIVFDESDWLPGLIPQFTSGGVFEGRRGLTFEENFDPHRVLGYAVPGFEPDTPVNSSVISGTIVAGYAKNASKAYLAASDGEIHELDFSTNTLTNGGGWPYSIAAAGVHAVGPHTGFSPEDFVTYTHNVGGTLTKNAFYSYNDGTDWDVGMFNQTATFDDDFMSNVPATPLGTTAADLTGGKGFPHPLVVGEDGFLYMGSSQYLHAYDGTNGANGTFESQALDLEPGWIVSSTLRTEHFLFIFAYRLPTAGASLGDARGESAVFWWDYVSPSFDRVDHLEDNYVTGAFFFRGKPACFTFGRAGLGGKRGKLRILNAGEWEEAAQIPDYPVNRGVDMIGRQAIFETAGILYSYGAPFVGQPDGLNSIANLAGSSRGMVRNFNAAEILASSGSFLQRVSRNYGQGYLLTQYATPRTPARQQRQIDYVRLYFRKAATGGRVLAVNLISNGGATTTPVFSSGTVTAGNLIRDEYYDTSGATYPSMQNMALELQWQAGSGSSDAPALLRAEVYLKPFKILGQQ